MKLCLIGFPDFWSIAEILVGWGGGPGKIGKNNSGKNSYLCRFAFSRFSFLPIIFMETALVST